MGHAADAAANLNLETRTATGNLRQDSMILRRTFKSSIEVDNMQPLRAAPKPPFRHFKRFSINRHFVGPALAQAYRLSLEYVDGRINVHIRPKLSSNRSPTFWLFSG